MLTDVLEDVSVRGERGETRPGDGQPLAEDSHDAAYLAGRSGGVRMEGYVEDEWIWLLGAGESEGMGTDRRARPGQDEVGSMKAERF